MSGAFNFSQKCKDKGVKPVFGAELYLNDNIGMVEEKKFEGDNCSVKLIVKNYDGYVNLSEVDTRYW